MRKNICSTTKHNAWVKLIRKTGILFYLIALFAPPNLNFANDFHLCGGLVALIETPIWAFTSITDSFQDGRWQGWILGLSMILGWTSNFWIYFRIPFIGTLFAIMLPWILFISVTFFENVAGISRVAIDFVPFYPWAVGIALIQWSRLAEPKPKEEIRSTWTGV